jgi:hypothetical protein
MIAITNSENYGLSSFGFNAFRFRTKIGAPDDFLTEIESSLLSPIDEALGNTLVVCGRMHSPLRLRLPTPSIQGIPRASRTGRLLPNLRLTLRR